MNFLKLACVAAALSVSMMLPATAATMSEADCEAWFTKADTNGDGSLGGTESEAYVTKMASGGTQPSDNTMLTKADFMTECQKGTFEGMN